MNRLNYKIFLLMPFVIFSCKKDDTAVSSSLNAPVIKGFICRNEAGDNFTIIGVPDVKLNDSESSDPNHYKYSMLSYPNPNVSNFYVSQSTSAINFSLQSLVLVNSASFWIEKGDYGNQPDQTMQVLGASTIVASTHYAEITKLDMVTGDNQLYLDVSHFEPGYYRAYFKVNGVLLWDNLIINLNPF